MNNLFNFQDFHCTSVCGNVKGLGLPDSSDESNGPISRVYTSGQWIEVTAEVFF